MSRPRPRGEVGGSGQGGVSRPTPGGSRPTRGGPGPHLRGVQAQPWGVSRPSPGGCSGPGPGGVSQHALRQTPLPSRWLLLWVVRILLECILVLLSFY